MSSQTAIKVVGVGGAGNNAISRMFASKIPGVELLALNTDLQDLRKIKAHRKLQIGRNLTGGFGVGMNPELGRKAAEEQKEEIEEILRGADIIFVAAGLGGGTGSGASPVVAAVAKGLGALVIAVVTKPFSFEGVFRQKVAQRALDCLREKVDTLLCIPNDKMLCMINQETSVSSAFWLCDETLRQAVQGISDLIVLPGIVNVDFADIKAIMSNAGRALLGIGLASGKNRARIAAEQAINSPLLESSLQGGSAVLFNVSGGRDMALSEIKEIAGIITQKLHSQAKVIFGAVEDKKLKKGELKVALIVTGL